jgi:hypothetical protein
MDSNQIETISRSNPTTKYSYLGCFPEKSIPMKKMNGFMIVNNESDPNKMGHWLLIFNDDKNHYFFDSFGFQRGSRGGGSV